MKSGALWTAVVVQLASAATLHAQPWVPPQGEGTVSLTYQNYYVTGHFDVQGNTNTNGATHAKALIAEVDFGLSDTIALTVALPFIATKYTGPAEYFVGGIATHPGPLDDRKYHGTFQDVRVEMRRVYWAGPVAFAPLAGVTIPTHDYETHGEAVAGRHRRELQIGATAGADLNRILPRTYVHGRYALGAAERRHGFTSLKSNVDVDGGFDLSRLIGLRGLASWQFRHKGPTLAELAAHDWLGHDRFMVSSYFNVGGGVSVSLTRNAELHALWVGTISGKGGAHRARMLAIGASWSFGGGMGGFGGFAAVNDERSRSIRQRAGF
jgi:hypothetical protein